MSEIISKICFGVSTFCVLFLLIGCSKEEESTLNLVEVQFSDTKMSIPKGYILGDLPSSVVSSDNLDDVDAQISMKVPLSELNIESKEGPSLQSNIIFLIGNLSNESSSKDVENARNKTGFYKDAIVEKDPVLALYRVYPKSGHPKLWHYFKSDSPSVIQSSEWVGSCIVGPLEGENADLSNVKCTAMTSYKDLAIKYTTSAKYFSEEFYIRKAIADKFSKWDVDAVH